MTLWRVRRWGGGGAAGEQGAWRGRLEVRPCSWAVATWRKCPPMFVIRFQIKLFDRCATRLRADGEWQRPCEGCVTCQALL